jgi:hypothetical protein
MGYKECVDILIGEGRKRGLSITLRWSVGKQDVRMGEGCNWYTRFGPVISFGINCVELLRVAASE